MKKNITFLAWVGVLILLVGCSIFSEQESTETPEPTPPPRLAGTSVPEDRSITSPVTLQIWLPPQFDPTNGTDEGSLLQARLDEFTERHPGVRVEVRIKALDGSASLIESLIAADAAAPLVLPDLVAFPTEGFQIAAARNLIYPLESYLSSENGEDWYSFAEEMSLYNGQIFGQPFAGDALVMAYRPVVVGDPPTTWDEVLQIGRVFSFPAAEERALYTLALYESRAGELYDEDGSLQLNPTFLESVFNFYQKAEEANVMPYLLTQYTTDELSWQAFMENRTQMNITWVTRYFNQAPEGISAAAIPTYDGVPFTLAAGWVWTLTGDDPDRHQQAVDLVEFLTEEEFLGLWTSAAGFLPPRPSSLAFWPQGSDQALASQILPSAAMIPDKSILDFLGNLLAQATIDILKQAATAGEATDTVMAGLGE